MFMETNASFFTNFLLFAFLFSFFFFDVAHCFDVFCVALWCILLFIFFHQCLCSITVSSSCLGLEYICMYIYIKCV